ncbi:immune inhibitor A peptidase M6 family protein, partial [Vibrio parahaemolyticus IDH02189]
PIFR